MLCADLAGVTSDGIKRKQENSKIRIALARGERLTMTERPKSNADLLDVILKCRDRDAKHDSDAPAPASLHVIEVTDFIMANEDEDEDNYAPNIVEYDPRQLRVLLELKDGSLLLSSP